jgi:hypothetical protein
MVLLGQIGAGVDVYMLHEEMYNDQNQTRRNEIYMDVPIYIPAATAAWADLSIPVTLLLASSLSSGLN